LRNRVEYPILSFDGIPLFRVAVKRLVTAVMDLLKEFGVTVEDLRRVVFHQANGRLLAAVLDRLGIAPDQMYSVLDSTAMPHPRRCRLRWTLPSGKGRWRLAISSCWGRLAAVSRGVPALSVGDIYRRSSRVCSA
jgi:hypothetical protein